MAKEGDQTRWVGIRPTDPSEDIPTTTRKLAPAIGDLQAIKAPHYHYNVQANEDCSVLFYLGSVVCDPGEIWVITNLSAINHDSLCDILFFTRCGAVTRRLCGHYSVEPDTIVNWSGQLFLVEGDYALIGFALGGATDDVRGIQHGYKIGVY